MKRFIAQILLLITILTPYEDLNYDVINVYNLETGEHSIISQEEEQEEVSGEWMICLSCEQPGWKFIKDKE